MIRPRPAVRAFALAALLALVGAALAVGATVWGWPSWLAIVGVVVILLGFVLVGAAATATRRQEVTVLLTDEGYRIVEPVGERTGLWRDVTRVTGTTGRITLHHGPEKRVQIVVPQERTGELNEITAEIGRRLDRSRGYRNL